MNQFNHIVGIFHPMLVHLPIGFLLLGILFYWLSFFEKFSYLINSVRLIYLLGSIAAIFSCITGWCLSSTTFYEEDVLQYHQWMGITLACLSVVMYFVFNQIIAKYNCILSVIVCLLLIVTGHYGATLTHGTFSLNGEKSKKEQGAIATNKKNIQNVEDAVLFADIIQPIFQENCYNCHSASKQKGNLRLDNNEGLMKGGKAGLSIVPNDVDKSILFQRLVIDHADKKHMPPSSEPQLTQQQIELIRWWIASGCNFNAKVNALHPSAKELKLLKDINNASQLTNKIALFPSTPVNEANPSTVNQLIQLGAAIVPIANNSNYLAVDFLGNNQLSDKSYSLMAALKDQIVSLKISHNTLNTSALKNLSALQNLYKLDLPNCTLQETNLDFLLKLQHLQSLNLVGVNVVFTILNKTLSGLKIKKLFIYNTPLIPVEKRSLINNFTSIKIDTGNYQMPLMESDTTEVKMAPQKL